MDRLKDKIILISGERADRVPPRLACCQRRSAGRYWRRDRDRPRALASELGHAATFVRHDVTQERDWETAINAAEKLGGLHGLDK